ncbi:hypothetical protein [Streptomyces sp. DH24]|uniref:SCO2102 family sporulation regulator n=1 Tax=Streptomyces sp. DH24 TaxID=3040123 RepID=UPI00244128FA|nr:hypothetical protein [Streptomyces sp. DH24]MDG9716227.1 hypothetical protein [Streptomyces sp. DH24]
MGWTVLYIAFGIVALWLLGEVLLQYKARLRWRLLAFAGFLGVVLGVLIPSVVVIGLGAAAFAVGQTYVTLSFRSGFAAGWAVNAPALSSKTRRYDRDRQEPSPEDSGLAGESEYGDGTRTRSDGDRPYGTDDYDRDDVFTPARPTADPTPAESTAVYAPQPLPDDTGSYGVYADTGYPQGDPQHAAAAQGADQNYAYGYTGYDQNYGYDATGQQQYAAYSDPYIGTQTYGGAPYDPAAYGQQAYGQQDYTQDQYAAGYGGETPPGGVWVPQQRSTDDPYGGELPPEQPYPYQGEQPQQPTQGTGYDEQYRY